MKTCPSCHLPVTKSNSSVCKGCGYTFKEAYISGHSKILWVLITVVLVFLTVCFVVPQKIISPLAKINPGGAGQNAPVLFQVPQPGDAGHVLNPYDQFLKQYAMRPDAKIIKSFELTIDLYNQYLKLMGQKDGFSMGFLSQSNGQVKISVLKNRELVKIIQLPTNMSFRQAMEGLSNCLNAMAAGAAPLPVEHNPVYGSYDSGKYQTSLNDLYEMDSRKIIEGLLGLEELIRSIGPDPKLILAAARGYAFLQMVLYPDKMERSDDFAARALSLLALSNHLSPDMPSLREEALISMNIGYKAHAQSLIGRLPVPSQEACDGIIDAYLKKDISRLSELKGESPGAMGYYFLTRLYRESGLFMEAKQHGTDLLLRLKDHYPSVVEMIYSADLGTARILTTLYPLHILLCMEYEVGSKDLNRLETIEERLKIFLGESSIGGKTSFTEFEALLSQWQPLPEGVTTGFFIASSQIKTIYRTLYSGAIYLRHNLLLNRLSSMDAAQNYVKSIFSGNETHPLAMSMLADVWSNLGKYNQAKALCEQIVNHPQTKANLVMKAYFCVDDIQFKLKIAPGVFKKLDSNPANQRRMGNLFQWLHNYDMAENFYKTSLEKDPYAFSTYLRLAKVTGDSEPVSKGFEKYSHNYSFLEKAGDYYKEFKDTNLKLKALDCYDKALNQAPSRQSLWRKKASLLKELGKYEKAQQTITTWLEQYGSNNLTTTMMRAQLAKLLLKMEKPDQALKILENDLESYQAGVMMTLGQIYEALDRKNDAWSMYEKAVDRYPNVNHVLSGTAAFLWRENQYAAAAGFISKGRQVNNPFSRWYFDDYMTNFANALGNKVMESYKLVVESGAGNWERKALAYRFEEKKRPEISYLIMSGLSSPNRMQELENKIDQYKVLKNWKGKEAAQVILSPYFSPQLNGRISMVLFKEGLFDILLDEIKAPDDYPKNYKEFMWLMKLMAWIAREKPDSYHEELNRHYEKPASDYYHSIGSYLIGKISLHNLLALIKTPKQRCEFAYYIGYSFRMKNDFSTAANWYQICLETGLTNNGEYHWAADELFWWAHMGTRNRHKNLAQDISDYQKQEL